MEKRALEEHVAEWANRAGDGLDDLPQEKGRDVLRLLLDEVTIDGENKVNLTLAVPGEELCRLDHRYQFGAVPIMLVASDPAPYACCPPSRTTFLTTTITLSCCRRRLGSAIDR